MDNERENMKEIVNEPVENVENNEETTTYGENTEGNNNRFNPQTFNKNPISSGMSSNNDILGLRFGKFNRGKVGIIFLVAIIVVAIVISLVLLLK